MLLNVKRVLLIFYQNQYLICNDLLTKIRKISPHPVNTSDMTRHPEPQPRPGCTRAGNKGTCFYFLVYLLLSVCDMKLSSNDEWIYPHLGNFGKCRKLENNDNVTKYMTVLYGVPKLYLDWVFSLGLVKNLCLSASQD